MKKIIFVSHPYSGPIPGSLMLKGFQLANYLEGECVSLSTSDILKIKDTNIILLGNMSRGLNLSVENLIHLKQNNNTIIIDPIDDLCYLSQTDLQSELEKYNNIDGVIYPNTYAQKYFSEYYPKGNQSISIAHHYDDNFNKIYIPKNRKFDVVYGGNKYNNTFLNNSPHWLKTYFIKNYNDFKDNIFNILINSPLHFNHRFSNTIDYYFKPATKLAVSAACESPIITTSDKAYVDLLPEDYPLFIKSDNINEVEEKFDLAKNIYNTNKWKELIEIMKEIKEKTSPLYISSLYLKYLKQF